MSHKTVWMPLLALLAPAPICAGVNEWTNVGPQGGSVQYLIVDPQNPTTVYASTSVGVFKSKDAGARWSNAGLSGFGGGSLVIDPQNPNTLYSWTPVSVEDDGAFVTTNLFQSTDGAATWNKLDTPLPSHCCFNVVFYPKDPSTIYAIAGSPPRELFKSTDGGANWTQNSGLPNQVYFVALAVDPQNANTLYAAGQGTDSAHNPVVAVFKSTDGGASWNGANAGLPGAGMGGDRFPFSAFAFDPKNPSTVYVTKDGTGVYKSTNGGASWRAANSGMPPPLDFRSCCVSGVLIDPQNTNTLYVPSRNGVIFKSTDGGGSWKAGPPVLQPPFILQPGPGSNVLAIDPQNTSTVYAATYNSVLKSADGGASWRVAGSGLRAIGVSSLAINPQSPNFLYAGSLLSTDAGMSWFALGLGQLFGVAALAIDAQTPSTVYAGSGCDDEGRVSTIFKSVDGGQNWMDMRARAGCLSTIMIDPQSASTIYTSSRGFGGVYKSIDGGITWNAMNSGLPGAPGGVSVNALAIDAKNTVYAGGPGGVFKTTDGGTTWSNAGLTIGINALAVDPANVVYAATSVGLFKSTDNGASWRNLFPSSSTSVYAVVINPQNPNTIYSGTDIGVAQSADGGESWTPMSGGPDRIRLLTLDPQDPNTVYAGGPGGLFAISLTRSRR